MAHVSLDSSRIVAVIGELVAAGMPQHVGVSFDSQAGFGGARSIIREKPGADNGAPRSDTNTNGEAGLSR
jgi:hypothetical protein